jgi:hypothetical protein
MEVGGASAGVRQAEEAHVRGARLRVRFQPASAPAQRGLPSGSILCFPALLCDFHAQRVAFLAMVQLDLKPKIHANNPTELSPRMPSRAPKSVTDRVWQFLFTPCMFSVIRDVAVENEPGNLKPQRKPLDFKCSCIHGWLDQFSAAREGLPYRPMGLTWAKPTLKRRRFPDASANPSRRPHIRAGLASLS